MESGWKRQRRFYIGKEITLIEVARRIEVRENIIELLVERERKVPKQ